MGMLLCCERDSTREQIVSKITVEHLSHHYPHQKMLGLSNYLPCRYLGQGILGSCVEIFEKENDREKRKYRKYAQKIISTANIFEDYVFLNYQQYRSVFVNYFIDIQMWKIEQHKIYIFMEIMNMGNLQSYASKNKKPFDNKNIRQLCIRVIKMLQTLHDKGLIYRNLKPENILFANKQGLILFSQSPFCVHGPICHSYYGSAQYCPPQVYLNKGYSYSADIWMFGILLYELVMKKTPFEFNQLSQIKNAVLDFNPQKLFTQEVPQLCTEFQQLIVKMLEPDPQLRITLQKIKQCSFFENVEWETVRDELTNLSFKYKDERDEIDPPKRMTYINIEKSRPLTQKFEQLIFEDNF